MQPQTYGINVVDSTSKL